MSTFHDDRLREALLHAAQEFVNRESNRTSLITVTSVDMRDDTVARFFVSVFPPESTPAALEFLNRSRSDFAEFFKKHVRARSVPHIEFQPDPGMGSPPLN